MKKKLSTWAKENGLSYRNAWSWIKNGKFPLPLELTNTGRYLVIENDNNSNPCEETTVIYVRVSNQSRKNELDYQVNRCEDFCISNGWKITKTFKEVASGMNDERKELWKAINLSPTRIIVENKDRLTRFGFTYLQQLLRRQGTEIIVINESKEDKEDLIKDMASVIYSFCARLYGLRRAANKALNIRKKLQSE